MEPGTSASTIPSPEMTAHQPEAPKIAGGEAISHVTEKLPEKIETKETSPQVSSGPAPVVALPILPPVSPSAVGTPVVAVVSDTSSPQIAADDDLVEKEWVDKAKKIVAQTRSDPYSQEKEVSKLQADYLKKRYGKELKVSSE